MAHAFYQHIYIEQFLWMVGLVVRSLNHTAGVQETIVLVICGV
jgi:hypothetical protein